MSNCDCSYVQLSDNDRAVPNGTNCLHCGFLKCRNNLVFQNKVEPPAANVQPDFTIFNPAVYLDNVATDFKKSATPCGREGYVSVDPRLISNMHNGQVLYLDRPPTDDAIDPALIYSDPRIRNYRGQYADYADVKSGQIMYYVDNNFRDVLYAPVFANAAQVVGYVHRTPVDDVWLEYDRQPLKVADCLRTKGRTYEGGLSFLEQTTETREDLMHLQSRRMNRTRFAPTTDPTYG